ALAGPGGAGAGPPRQKPADPKAKEAARPAPPAGDDEVTDPSKFVYTTDEAIQLFEARVKQDPQDYISLATLGDPYENRARETDALAYYERAGPALRRAVAISPGYPRARVSLAVVLCDRHKFADGLALAREVLKAAPDNPEPLAVIGDA